MEFLQKKMLKVSTGETLAYVDTEIGTKTLVLIHGNMSSSWHYAPLIERLKKDYRIIAMDMRGFGDSTYHRRFDSMQELKQDILSLLDLLKIQTFAVAGWSAGGGPAMLFAAQHPDRVTHLILIDSMSYRGLPVFQKDDQGKMILGKIYETKEALAQDKIQVIPLVLAAEKKDKAYMKWLWDLVIYTAKKPDEKDNDVYLDETLKQRNLVDFDWAIMHFNIGSGKSFYAEGNNLILNIQCPVLTVWGALDKTVLEFMFRETAAVLGSRCTQIVYEQCGHSPIVDVPDRLAKDIQALIQ